MCGCQGGFGGGGPGVVSTFCQTITFAQLAAAALQNSFTAWAAPAKTVFLGAIVRPIAAFAGPGITDYKVSLGINPGVPDLERWLLKFDVDTAPAGTNHGDGGPNFELLNYSAAVNILLTAYSTGANLNAANAGSLSLCIFYTSVP